MALLVKCLSVCGAIESDYFAQSNFPYPAFFRRPSLVPSQLAAGVRQYTRHPEDENPWEKICRLPLTCLAWFERFYGCWLKYILLGLDPPVIAGKSSQIFLPPNPALIPSYYSPKFIQIEKKKILSKDQPFFLKNLDKIKL